MTSLIEWLLGLEHIRLSSDRPLSVRLLTPPEAWIQLVGLVFAVIFIVFLYRREMVDRRWRRVLIGLRMALILLIMGLVARPMLVLRRSLVEPSRAIVLLDDSSSMGISDEAAEAEPAGSAPGARRRWDAAIDALCRPGGLLEQLTAHQKVEVWTFSSEASPVGSVTNRDDLPGLAAKLRERKPGGARTDLVGAVGTALAGVQAGRLAGLIVVSDGSQNVAAQPESVATAALSRSAAVYAMLTGSPQPRPDIAVASIWADSDVLIRDPVSIRVGIEGKGYAQPVNVELQLRDALTDRLIESQVVPCDPHGRPAEAEFVYAAAEGGAHRLRVTAVPQANEIVLENNAAETTVTVHDEKIGVLFVESRPRFEWRYLKNLIVRETGFDSSCMLIDADPGFAQEGTRPIQHFPESVEELRQYDVIIFGDVDPREPWIDSSQVALVDQFVGNLGGGVAFLAGERGMPGNLSRTAWARLLPVRINADEERGPSPTLEEGFAPVLTSAGHDSPLFRLAIGGHAESIVPDELPAWFWCARNAGAKPGSIVLATHPSLRTRSGEPMPLVALGRYGAGRTCIIGSDDVWRWRRFGGEAYYDNMWLQIVRTLARGKRLGLDRPWRLATDRRTYDLGQPVGVTLRGVDREAGAIARETAEIDVTEPSGRLVRHVDLSRSRPNPAIYSGQFVPDRPGGYTLTVVQPRAIGARRTNACTIEVSAADPERDRMEADPSYLQLLADRTGGTLAPVSEDPSRIAAALPDRSIETPDDIEEPLWDSRLAVIGFVILALAEWIVRKGRGLA